ncbi:fumarylacetoacetate hydrolase domain-containing protein 2A isoform X1 [Erpetoichthys calabaricus]|uniref:fumarylacetoacetate hydrolase domain-containing protein 2A isoform X1 n=2 Tax=Erpetoichthys calabaricus TaxID=27687 RepID=UPI002234E2B0|nr:fumarylacetoacetate hydrolase domain-containing protein 2A isoform X1 [Erpetoichthys calabaricus]
MFGIFPSNKKATGFYILTGKLLVNCACYKEGRSGRRFLSGAMRLVQFQPKGGPQQIRIGVEESNGGNIIDLNAFDPTLPHTMRGLLEMGAHGMETARRALGSGQHVVPRSQVSIFSPITNPDKVVCVGMNYEDHCREQNVPLPKEPIIFNKFSSCIVGPYDDIIYPAVTTEVDWEVELAFVIGKTGKDIEEKDALGYIAGFTVADDVSARDWQKRNGKQWLLSKTFDTFCPLGPALVTPDALSDPHNLKICCRVNGEVVQDSNTNKMIFKTAKLVSWMSQFTTLYPGDVFLTGTPPGVGVFRKPPVFLKKGDVVECEIEEIGLIQNRVV